MSNNESLVARVITLFRREHPEADASANSPLRAAVTRLVEAEIGDIEEIVSSGSLEALDRALFGKTSPAKLVPFDQRNPKKLKGLERSGDRMKFYKHIVDHGSPPPAQTGLKDAELQEAIQSEIAKHRFNH